MSAMAAGQSSRVSLHATGIRLDRAGVLRLEARHRAVGEAHAPDLVGVLGRRARPVRLIDRRVLAEGELIDRFLDGLAELVFLVWRLVDEREELLHRRDAAAEAA